MFVILLPFVFEILFIFLFARVDMLYFSYFFCNSTCLFNIEKILSHSLQRDTYIDTNFISCKITDYVYSCEMGQQHFISLSSYNNKKRSLWEPKYKDKQVLLKVWKIL